MTNTCGCRPATTGSSARAFPGLWLDPAALLAGDPTRVLEVLDRGLASPEHEAFARELAG